jgi:hypothetical protein
MGECLASFLGAILNAPLVLAAIVVGWAAAQASEAIEE